MEGLDATMAKLRGLPEKKITVAAVAALNDAAYLGKVETAKAVAAVFDRPTPWVRGSVRYSKARKDKLEAQIDFDFWGNKQGVTVEKVIQAQIFGGPRRHKRHEVALRRMGILPDGMFIVPGEAATMDAYGNMVAGQINQVMAWFNAFGEQGYKSNMTAATRARRAKGSKRSSGFEYFVVRPGDRREFIRSNGSKGTHKMQPGIYQRVFMGMGTAIKPIMIFVRSPIYQRRLDFYGIAEKAALKEFNRAFPMYLDKLLKERGL